MPYYLSIGVTEEKFWESCPIDLEPYRIAEEKRIENMQIETWLSGRYTYEAVSIAIANGFGKKKYKYPDVPYGLSSTDEEKEEKLTDAEKFEIWVSVFNKKFRADG